jgi:cell division septation protein DedD
VTSPPRAGPAPKERTLAPAATPLGRPEFHVQAGAFKNRENADDLIRQLRANGYTVTLVEGPLYRVWVGPAMSRAAAERFAANLQANGFEAALSPIR